MSTLMLEHVKLSKKNYPKKFCKTSKDGRNSLCVVTCGSLMYDMVATTRPNIAHTVRVISGYMSNPKRKHLEVVKSILKYLSIDI